jgi:hypothetical protein
MRLEWLQSRSHFEPFGGLVARHLKQEYYHASKRRAPGPFQSSDETAIAVSVISRRLFSASRIIVAWNYLGVDTAGPSSILLKPVFCGWSTAASQHPVASWTVSF